ncbi:carbohydrate-binding module family 50 protein [Apiospora arundinis]
MISPSKTALLALALTVNSANSQAPGPTQPGTVSSCTKWHVVKGTDTCASLESTYKISHVDFLKWNPAVSSDCRTNFWPDYAYCVAAGAGPTTTSKPPTSRITAPPGPTQTGTPANCNSWYVVQADDGCDAVEKRFGITHAQFLAWNPSVSQDCRTNFWPTYAYCVGIDPNGPTTRPPTTTSSSRSTVQSPTTPYSTRNPITNYTLSEPPPAPTEWPPTKTLPGQPSYCNEWYYVQPGDDCQSIMRQHSGWAGLQDLSPALRQLASAAGAFGQLHFLPDAEPRAPALGLPVVVPNKLLAKYTFLTQSQFLAWHPFLNGNCDGLWAGYYYCVWAGPSNALPPVSTVSVKPPASSLPSPPGGVTDTCTGWYEAGALDSCDDVVDIFGTFSRSQFEAWNPAAGAGAACSLVGGLYYCVAVPGTPTSRTVTVTPSSLPWTTPISSSPTTSPTTSEGGPPVATPTPIQNGMVAGCKKFVLVQPDDGCWAIANAAGINLDDFYAWNPAVKTDCSGLWPNYYVCIGK